MPIYKSKSCKDDNTWENEKHSESTLSCTDHNNSSLPVLEFASTSISAEFTDKVVKICKKNLT